MSKFVVFLLSILALAQLSSSSCCWDLSGGSASCKPNTARHTCNPLCCSCASTCDVSKQTLQGTILIDSAKSIMDMADHDGDEQLSVAEASAFLHFMGEEMNSNTSEEIPAWFKNMDVDDNGKIQPLELDPDFFFISSLEKNETRTLARIPRSPDSLWSCFHLASRGRECLGAIIDYVPCVNIAKNIFDIIHLATREHGRQACTDMIDSAVSLPINAVGCATFGLGTIAELFTGDWVKVQLANAVALKMPGKLAAWLGCPAFEDSVYGDPGTAYYYY
eukprot:GFUD01000317.1.p1 GENE.GFUD01000317.1~~GFUD01000317.1.p1  ORF type:complete len:277 (+),score=51.32 GFUD01000317.1:16-846(+)